MKKNIFVALAAAVMLLFSACSKDIDLVGTTWKSNTINQTINYMGMSGTVTMDLTIQFTDATNYTLTTAGSVSIMGMSQPINDTENGTYTFDGENGMLDGEQAFSYNKKDKTLNTTIKVDDPEYAEFIGSDEIVLTFTQQK